MTRKYTLTPLHTISHPNRPLGMFYSWDKLDPDARSTEAALASDLGRRMGKCEFDVFVFMEPGERREIHGLRYDVQ